MVLKLLEVLRKGLNILKDRIKAKEPEALQAQLAEKKSTSSLAQDEQRLDDNANANLVDKQQVLQALENASDHERSVARPDGELFFFSISCNILKTHALP